ncbi:hypothetical protein C4J94_1905 [Pseudomonas sp. R5-89-07]|nr:hypothetical protein C4J94_1905 [Pseudomonas sp. R5-89-07]
MSRGHRAEQRSSGLTDRMPLKKDHFMKMCVGTLLKFSLTG